MQVWPKNVVTQIFQRLKNCISTLDSSIVRNVESDFSMNSEEASFKRRNYLSTIAEESGASGVTLGESRVILGKRSYGAMDEANETSILRDATNVEEQEMDFTMNAEEVSFKRRNYRSTFSEEAGLSRTTLGESRVFLGEPSSVAEESRQSRLTLGEPSSVTEESRQSRITLGESRIDLGRKLITRKIPCLSAYCLTKFFLSWFSTNLDELGQDWSKY